MFGFSKKKSGSSAAHHHSSALGGNNAPSVISADMNVLGSIISDGFIDIDGTVNGNVKCASAVIRENGIVNGDVTADSVQIYGYIEGLVKAESVSLYGSAHVLGTIMHESLTIEDGAFVDGKFKRMGKKPASPESADNVELLSSDAQDDDKEDDAPEESVMDNIKLISG